MNKTDFNSTSENILVLGAGELGLPVLRNLALRAKDVKGTKISVLLRESTLTSDEPVKKLVITEIRNLGINIVTGDLVMSSVDDLASLFAQFDTVVGCTG